MNKLIDLEIGGRKIENRDIGMFFLPMRYLYRLVKKYGFPISPKLKQIERNDIEYIIWANEEVGKSLYLRRCYEKKNLMVFSEFIDEGDICFDIGGNIGYFALNFANLCGPKGLIHVFEPVEKNALVIELASLINGFDNIFVHREAVSDNGKGMEYVILDADSAYSFSVTERQQVSQNTVMKKSITLDTFVSKHDIKKPISVIKIDVEGAEGLVLRGAREILKNKKIRPKLIMAELVNDYLAPFNDSTEGIICYMEKFGYQAFFADQNGNLTNYSADESKLPLEIFFLSKDYNF